jgi:hypothetical protein
MLHRAPTPFLFPYSELLLGLLRGNLNVPGVTLDETKGEYCHSQRNAEARGWG